jgi:F-type H+-transporting ATPase subunit delta
MELSIEQNILEDVLQDVKTFVGSLESRDLYLMLKSPIIKQGKKAEIFKLIFDKKLGVLTMAFFSIVLKKGREEFLPEIAEEFLKEYKEHKGITTVNLTTASELNDKTLAQIKNKLLGSDITLEKIELIHKIDENLLGGFVVEVEDKLYDASAARKIEEFKKSLLDNKYVASL